MDLTHARHPNVDMGERVIPLTREIYIDRKDFEEVPPKGFKRLIPDGEVRLRHAYVIKCDEVIKDANGEVIELKCSIDPETLGKNPEGRKVKGVIHWVSATKGVPAEVRIYDRLFTEAAPDADDDFLANLNPESLKVVQAVNLLWLKQNLKIVSSLSVKVILLQINMIIQQKNLCLTVFLDLKIALKLRKNKAMPYFSSDK
jgi:glutaminyl-tRNA synthetase